MRVLVNLPFIDESLDMATKLATFIALPGSARFQIRYGEVAQEAIAAMGARDRAIVLAGIRNQLSEEPLRETRNRKPMRATTRVAALGITWELRISGIWRVFYSVDAEIVTVDVIDIARKGRETTDEVLGQSPADEQENEP